jgi:hypothetical protein
MTHLATTVAAHPYLGHVAPPPLRMREPQPLLVEIPAVEPASAEQPAPVKPASQPAIESSPAPAAMDTPAPEPAPPAPARPAATPPPPILQDPLRERVQLEDFLPFFTPPAPAQPESRATYRRE